MRIIRYKRGQATLNALKKANCDWVVYVDIDGVLLDVYKGVDDAMHKKFGIADFSAKVFHSWSDWTAPKGVSPQAFAIMKNYVKQDLFASADFMCSLPYCEGAIEGFKMLRALGKKRGFAIVINSMTPKSMRIARMNYLQKALGTDVEFEFSDFGDNKYCYRNTLLFIDDSLDVFLNLEQDAVAFVALIDSVHNKQKNNEAEWEKLHKCCLSEPLFALNLEQLALSIKSGGALQ